MPALFVCVPSTLWRLLAAVVSAALAGVLAGCAPAAEPSREPVRSVKVLTVAATQSEAGMEFAAEVRPRVESRLGFRVNGKLLRRLVEVGQRVRQGQLLAEVDPRDFQLVVESARAQVAAAQTQRDLAAADVRRYQALKDQNFISGAELERREATLKGAQAALEQAQAQLNVQSNQTAYARLVADVAGVVLAVDAEVGQVVAAGTPVVRIAQDGPRDAVFAVPEDKLALFKPGLPLMVREWASGRQLEGAVREVAPAADPVTRTFAVKAVLKGTDLPIGATVQVLPLLPMAATPVIKLPTSALRQQGADTVVWVLDSAAMTVRQQPVRIASADVNEAVISSGLTPGMTVVSTGVHVLSPGQKVSIYQDKRVQSSANPQK